MNISDPEFHLQTALTLPENEVHLWRLDVDVETLAVMLKSPVEEFNPDWTYVKDVMVNIAGFVPLGVVLCAYVVWTKTPKTAIQVHHSCCSQHEFRGRGAAGIYSATSFWYDGHHHQYS